MDPAYSRLLINQWVIPTQRATTFMMYQDLNMMAPVSAMERTEEETRELLRRAGLGIVKIWKPEDSGNECIVEAMRV